MKLNFVGDLQALTYRVGHHSTSDDSTKYRPAEEIEHWKMAKSPVTKFQKWVERNGWWNEEDELEIRDRIKKEVKATRARNLVVCIWHWLT